MRGIKFRAWHLTSKKMFDVLCIDLDAEFGGVWKWGKAYHDHDTGEHEADKDFIVHDQIELMQFTGFTDKHGKDIYEGDIIKHPPYWHDDREVHAVKDIHMFCGDYGNYGDIETEIEVIGNIYETPELLKEAQ